MNGNYMSNPLIFIISTLFHLYAFALALRFILQWVRADFYNPLSQFVVKVTTPVVRPARNLIPGYKGLDLATLIVCYLILALSQAIVQSIGGYPLTVASVVIMAITDTVSLFIDVFFYAILIQALISWVNPHGGNPISYVLASVTAPVLRPVQKFIPPIGGMDISPVFAMIGLKVIEMLINPIFYALLK
ncbi:MAG: YggT family protein [Gammaproteobacteria bacterium]|nr:YggT family protein [Gammaproteobacteria bacterium]